MRGLFTLHAERSVMHSPTTPPAHGSWPSFAPFTAWSLTHECPEASQRRYAGGLRLSPFAAKREASKPEARWPSKQNAPSGQQARCASRRNTKRLAAWMCYHRSGKPYTLIAKLCRAESACCGWCIGNKADAARQWKPGAVSEGKNVNGMSQSQWRLV